MARFVALIVISFILVSALVIGLMAGAVVRADAASMSYQDGARQDGAREGGAQMQAMQTAEQLYAKGSYALAAKTYQQLVDQGLADGALYYNLGLSYLQAGDLGRALWSLRMAQQLDPRDAQIEATLADVRSRITDAAGTEHQAFGAVMAAAGDSVVARGASLTDAWFTLDELALIALGLWTLFALLLLVWVLRVENRFARKLARIATPVVGILLFAAVLALGLRVYQTQGVLEAVVVAEQIELTSGPGAQYEARMTLPAGAEVNVLEERGDWAFVRLDGNGPTGWAPSVSLAALRLRG